MSLVYMLRNKFQNQIYFFKQKLTPDFKIIFKKVLNCYLCSFYFALLG